jgi:sulfate permease, SulP family
MRYFCLCWPPHLWLNSFLLPLLLGSSWSSAGQWRNGELFGFCCAAHVAAVILVTFLLTIFHDLTAGILGGFGLGTLLLLNRISQSVEIEKAWPVQDEDAPESDSTATYNAGLATDPNILVYRISGAVFFGTAASVASVLDELAERPNAFILDFSQVPLLDSTAAATLDGFTRKTSALVYVTGATKRSAAPS